MLRIRTKIRLLCRRCPSILALWVIAGNGGFGSTASTSQTLDLSLSPIAKLSVPASLTAVAGNQKFAAFTATLPVSYRLRTTPSGGGTLTVRVSTDFTPAGGPSAAGGALTYSCGWATLGTPCSGNQTASTTAQTPVLTLPASACTGGGGACSAQDPNSVDVTFTLTDTPAYSTGAYSAGLTFVISAI